MQIQFLLILHSFIYANFSQLLPLQQELPGGSPQNHSVSPIKGLANALQQTDSAYPLVSAQQDLPEVLTQMGTQHMDSSRTN